MGHRNTQFTGHMIDSETDPHGHSHLRPEPCIFYGSVSNYAQPNMHPMVPTPANQCNFNFHPLQEHHESTLFYGMPQYNTGPPQHPPSNLDLAVASSSGHYNPYLAPQSGLRDFPVQVNHGARDQLSVSATHRIVGIPNIPYMDGVGGPFKRKNAEGGPASYQYHYASAGPSSSVAPINARPAESDITVMDAASFLPHDYGGNSNLIQGNYVPPPISQLHGNPWSDMHFAANNGDISTFAWTQAPNLPYAHAGANGACVEAANIGVQGYQVTGSNRSSAGFLHPPIAQGHHNPHHLAPLVQGVRGFNANYPPQVVTSSRRIPTINSSNTGINPFQDVADPGPTFLAPVPPTGFRVYRPHRREIIIDSNARHRNLPHLRVLPEDEVAILEIPGYHEAGNSIDQHRDMRLDIDHMSYEELLALGEQIGSVGTGLSEEFVRNNLKTRTFTSSEARINLEDATCPNQQINFCVICQTDYEYEDCIGTLDCGHEYHRECINKWLHVKNTCPVCKSTAVTCKGKNL
ncbi:hypothetical protein BUALT_Bualt03G0142100 [Buddleja alternifolia]|uniref:RING-type E3 ubiquitin transferase n=1 Tax=Buddleja alternifolia TaxID=168488 RepID=A0AAV6XVA7_9LAMI|nr:hypothetical protein BUALT_Bualt03G0142100 [Buddleja alternifolia]